MNCAKGIGKESSKNKIQDMSNEDLIDLLEVDITESTKKANSGMGTKTIDARIEKVKKEILKRLNNV